MSENKSLNIAVGIINNGGFEKDKMQAVVAKDVALDNDIHIAAFGNQAEIVMTSDALRKRNPFRVCLQKTPSGFVHGCVRGWTALRLNGLLKRKCKKGTRKHYSKK